jgi:hypothetical protein
MIFLTRRNKFTIFFYLIAITISPQVWPDSYQAILPAGMITGEAHMTYNQEAWATMVPEWTRTDIHGTPIEGTSAPTSDTDGNRFFYPQLFLDHNSPTAIKRSNLASEELIANGTADPEAVAQWRIYDPAQQVPLAQPQGGFTMQVDDLNPGVWWQEKSGWVPSNYNPTPQAGIPLQIGLGGSFRLASDFIAPGSSLWWQSLDIREQLVYIDSIGDYGYKWYIGSSGYSPGSGSIFELINPVFGVDTNGYTTLSADYKWGDSQWSNFFHFSSDPAISDKVLGHISMNVSAVPVPAAVWLFGSALFGLVGFKRRPSFIYFKLQSISENAFS